MKLISEHFSDDVQYITEQDSNGKKKFALKGIFMQAEIKNRNGRVYPFEVLNKEVERHNKEFIEQNRAYGELGHPDGPTVNLDKVSHMVTSLKPDGKNFIGEAKVMSTPMGEIVKNIMDDGGKLAVSSRGMGSLTKKNGANYVNDDFYLATAADIVADPSAPQAFVEGIMEGKEWIWDNGILREAEVQQIKEKVEKSSRKDREQTLVSAFEDFITKL
jgi:hypothetical protein